MAIYTKADRGSLHVKLADEVWVLPGLDGRGYLDGEAILGIASKAGVQAVVPGYGESEQGFRSTLDWGTPFEPPSEAEMRSTGPLAFFFASQASYPKTPNSRKRSNRRGLSGWDLRPLSSDLLD